MAAFSGRLASTAELGLRFGDRAQPDSQSGVCVDLGAVNKRVLDLARQQSADIVERVGRESVLVVRGTVM